MKYVLNVKGVRKRNAVEEEKLKQPCHFLQWQFCTIIIRILKILKLILASIAWFKVFHRLGIITVEKDGLKVIS